MDKEMIFEAVKHIASILGCFILILFIIGFIHSLWQKEPNNFAFLLCACFGLAVFLVGYFFFPEFEYMGIIGIVAFDVTYRIERYKRKKGENNENTIY